MRGRSRWYACWQPTRFASNGTRRFVQRRILMILPGNPTREKRLDVQMVGTLKGKRWLLHLWKEQGGLCPICQQKITKITGWHSHHVLWRSKGGSDRAENRILLHPTCHQQVHSQGLPVEKPRPVKRAQRKA